MPHVAGFDWDAGNKEKCQKRGLAVSSVEAAFHGPVAVYRDPAHSQNEERLKAIGKTGEGRPIFIIFTLRIRAGQMFIRPISARYMHAKEIAHYEKEAAGIQQR